MSLAAMVLLILPLGAEAPPSPSPSNRQRVIVDVLDVVDARTTERLPKETLTQLTQYVASLFVSDRFQVVPRGNLRTILAKRGSIPPADALLETTILKIGQQCSLSMALYQVSSSLAGQAVVEHVACDSAAISAGLDRAVAVFSTSGLERTETSSAAAAWMEPPDPECNQASASIKPKCSPFGFVTIDTRPPSEIYVDGVLIGETPLHRVKLPSGTKEIRAVNKRLGREKTIQIEVRPADYPDHPSRYQINL
jgi:hypothetical protein